MDVKPELKDNVEQSKSFKQSLHTVIFETDTKAGQRFDLVLIVVIMISVIVLMLESVQSVSSQYYDQLRWLEWVFTIIFSVEYALRIYCASNRIRYLRSFYGIIDLLAILPTYLSLFITGANYLFVVRLIRVMRVFKILHLVRYLSETNILLRALLSSWRKVFVFFVFVLILATLFGSIMYVVEGAHNGFTSIPKSIYWTIVTITTVGYGDITPHTVIGQAIAALAMLTGYSIIAVPTGILTAELSREMQRSRIQIQCKACGKVGHDQDAVFCKSCGHKLPFTTDDEDQERFGGSYTQKTNATSSDEKPSARTVEHVNGY